MKYIREIAVGANVKLGEFYPIYYNNKKIGEARLDNIETVNERFEFTIVLSGLNAEDYEYFFDLDSKTYDLVSMRAVK